MLLYPRDRLSVGGALVTEATDWLKRSGLRAFEAMHSRAGYPFYRGLWMGGEPMCPATLPHVQLAFEVGGYKSTQESVFMVAEMTSSPPEIVPKVAVELVEAAAEMTHEPMRESWIGFEPMRIRALIGGEEAGSISWALLPHVAERLGAPCMNIWGLSVREDYRRKGIASSLIARAMARSYALGARFASLGTQLWSAPAHATYSRLGFQPHCILVGRALDLDALKEES
jgi:GNAT superfamily N-acetyltransferase